MDKEYVMRVAATIREQLVTMTTRRSLCHGASGSLWQQYSRTCRD